MGGALPIWAGVGMNGAPGVGGALPIWAGVGMNGAPGVGVHSLYGPG